METKAAVKIQKWFRKIRDLGKLSKSSNNFTVTQRIRKAMSTQTGSLKSKGKLKIKLRIGHRLSP